MGREEIWALDYFLKRSSICPLPPSRTQTRSYRAKKVLRLGLPFARRRSLPAPPLATFFVPISRKVVLPPLAPLCAVAGPWGHWAVHVLLGLCAWVLGRIGV